ncbi:SDR family oxidoreductase [Pontibacter harenae]|uniref:SDR family oxidoreductase n=1 Tax=Pontibacter harenae TaxID=2894083 RepID=UPI001E30EFBF|nr:SDR family oxidoreductase [Pontibacter harenae]MCC9167072.1 SDR family oxidoreductase [Pontibacter harenae]
MAVKLKPLNEQVIVLTGASSGIGLATARAASVKGAKLVLASRNGAALADITQEINDAGGQAIYVVADVGNQQDILKIADAAISTFGGFDTWVNNAGVSIYGRLEEVSDEDNRRMFDTNFWGLVYGSTTAAKHLRNRGGAIINIGSVLSDVSIPLQGMYSASKHAVKGFTDSLRIELEEDKAPVSVTLVKPSGINTPYPEHAQNYTDRELTLPPPVYAPEEVANAILHVATHPMRDILVGSGGKAMSTTNKFAPGIMDWAGETMMSKMQVKDKPAQLRVGGLHTSGEGGRMYGNYEGHVMKTSLYTRAAMHPLITGAVVAAASAAAVALIGNSNSKKEKRSEKSGDWNRTASKISQQPTVVHQPSQPTPPIPPVPVDRANRVENADRVERVEHIDLPNRLDNDKTDRR